MPALKNTRHELFAQALAKGETAEAAYSVAGYKPSRSAASRLSTNVNISQRVAELVKRGGDRAEIDIARTLKELTRIGTSDVRKLMTGEGAILPVQELDDDTAAAVAGIEVVTKPCGEYDEDGRPIVERVHKVRLWDKNSALDKIAKHLGMFVERLEHTGPNGEPIQIGGVDKEALARELVFMMAEQLKP